MFPRLPFLLLLSSASLLADVLPRDFRVVAAAVDAAGAIYFAGETASFSLPTTTRISPAPGECSFQPLPLVSCVHGFVAKVDPSGDRLLWSTYFAGDGADRIRSLAITPGGDPVIAGNTTSRNLPLPGGYSPPRRPGDHQEFRNIDTFKINHIPQN
jgi:hypothetical protein